MPKYAENTAVSSSRSRDEIERTLSRYGATQFAYAWAEGRGMIGFVLNGKQVRLSVPLPDRSAREFTHTPTRGTLRASRPATVAGSGPRGEGEARSGRGRDFYF